MNTMNTQYAQGMARLAMEAAIGAQAELVAGRIDSAKRLQRRTAAWAKQLEAGLTNLAAQVSA